MLHVCMYVCMHVCVCLLMKGSVSFGSNNAKITQTINECSRHVNTNIQLKTAQNWLKNQWFKMGYVTMKWSRKGFRWNEARFFCSLHLLSISRTLIKLPVNMGRLLFIYYLMYVCMCVCLFVIGEASSILIQIMPHSHKKINDYTEQVIKYLRPKMVQNFEKFITAVLNFLGLNKLI